MGALENDDDLGRVVKAGYGAPPPRHAFAEALKGRVLQEYRRARASAPAAPRRWPWLAAAAAVVLGVGFYAALTWNSAPGPLPGGAADPVAFSTPGQMVPLQFDLPKATFVCTPRHIRPSPHLEPWGRGPRPPVFVPAGTTNVARGKPVTSSEAWPIIGSLNMATDGNKEAHDDALLELGPGVQWLQIDLGKPVAIHAICLWHYHAIPRVYHDVVVQVSDDSHFAEAVHTVYNNDYDNSIGLGLGKDLEYVDDYRGRLIETGGVTARYVRLYSNGSIDSEVNHYLEVEVYGQQPADVDAGEPGTVKLNVEVPSVVYQ